jgi:hypothetical protein
LLIKTKQQLVKEFFPSGQFVNSFNINLVKTNTRNGMGIAIETSAYEHEQDQLVYLISKTKAYTYLS